MPKPAAVSNLIDELGLTDLPEAKQTELLSLMTETVLKRILIEVLDKLSPQEQEEFDKIKELGQPEKMTSFLRSKIDNYDQLVVQIIAEFKNDLKVDLENL